MIQNKIFRMTAIGVLVFAAFLLFLAGLTYLTQTLWNWLVPTLFAGPLITFWQTLGLLALLKILLWPIGGGRRWSHYKGGPGYYWKSRWQAMTPEERERVKARMKEKWCRPRYESSAPSSEGPAAS